MPVLLFILFHSLFILWNMAMKVTGRSPLIYVVFWCLIIIFELCFIIYIITYKKINQNYQSIVIGLLLALFSMPAIISAFLTFNLRNFSILNTADFYYLILLVLGCIYILYITLRETSFLDNIETFFIFSGFALYFSLDLLLQNVLMLDYSKFWSIRQFSTILSQVYWLGSVIIIWKIRSKHLS